MMGWEPMKWDDVQYGNVADNRISLKQDSWQKVLANLWKYDVLSKPPIQKFGSSSGRVFPTVFRSKNRYGFLDIDTLTGAVHEWEKDIAKNPNKIIIGLSLSGTIRRSYEHKEPAHEENQKLRKLGYKNSDVYFRNNRYWVIAPKSWQVVDYKLEDDLWFRKRSDGNWKDEPGSGYGLMIREMKLLKPEKWQGIFNIRKVSFLVLPNDGEWKDTPRGKTFIELEDTKKNWIRLTGWLWVDDRYNVEEVAKWINNRAFLWTP